eukprot:gene24857-biopygen4447
MSCSPRGNKTVARAWHGHGVGVARATCHFWLVVARARRGHDAGVARALPVSPGEGCLQGRPSPRIIPFALLVLAGYTAAPLDRTYLIDWARGATRAPGIPSKAGILMSVWRETKTWRTATHTRKLNPRQIVFLWRRWEYQFRAGEGEGRVRLMRCGTLAPPLHHYGPGQVVAHWILPGNHGAAVLWCCWHSSTGSRVGEEDRGAAGRNGRGRAPDAPRTIYFKETAADVPRMRPARYILKKRTRPGQGKDSTRPTLGNFPRNSRTCTTLYPHFVVPSGVSRLYSSHFSHTQP